MEQAENTPLLNGLKTQKTKKPISCKPRIAGPEVVVILYALYNTPLLLTEQQFIYSYLQQEYTYINTSKDISFIREEDGFTLEEYENDVQARSAQIMLIMTVTSSLLSMVSSLFLGSYSDTKGRKLILIVSLSGGFIKSGTFLLVSSLNLSYWFLVFGHVIDGIAGSYQTLFTGCFAYGADVSKTNKRSLRVAVLEACLGISGAAGTISSGYISNQLGYPFTFATILGICILNLLYTICILPPATHKDEPVQKHSVFSYIYAAFKLYVIDNTSRRRWKLQYCLTLAFIIMIISNSKTDSQTYFLKGKPMQLDEIQIGFYTGWLTVVNYGGCLLTVAVLASKVGDHLLILMGCISGTLYYIYFAFVAHFWMLMTAPVVGLFSMLPIPMIRSISSKLVEPYEQGAMFAVIGCIEALSQLLGTIIYNSIYSATLDILPGFVFFIIAAQLFIAFLLSSLQVVLLKKEKINGILSHT